MPRRLPLSSARSGSWLADCPGVMVTTAKSAGDCMWSLTNKCSGIYVNVLYVKMYVVCIVPVSMFFIAQLKFAQTTILITNLILTRLFCVPLLSDCVTP